MEAMRAHNNKHRISLLELCSPVPTAHRLTHLSSLTTDSSFFSLQTNRKGLRLSTRDTCLTHHGHQARALNIFVPARLLDPPQNW